MKMTPADVLRMAQEHGARMVDFKFTDVPGTWQHFSIPTKALSESTFEEGIGFDGSSVRGFQQNELGPLLYVFDGDAVVLVASNGGSPRDPAWLHNLRRDPNVRFLSRERGWRAYRARLLTGAERARGWELATDLYAGYSDYQSRTTGREIPVVVLEPRVSAES